MTDEKSIHPQTIQFSASLDDLERLVRCIDRTAITELVKHDKHLQQHVFHGFRPTHLPWDRVPGAIARHAQECSGTMQYLLKAWQTANSSLKKHVKDEVHIDTLEDDLAKLLARLDYNGKDRLLWALLLDEREEIQAALTSGLRDALINEGSVLMVRAEQYRLAGELEKAKHEIDDLKAQCEGFKKQNELLHEDIERMNGLQRDWQALTNASAQVEVQYHEELSQLNADLQEVKHERDTAQAERDTVCRERDSLQADLEQEQYHSSELQKSITDLQRSLEVAIASQHENASDVKRQLDETLKLLETVRAENMKLRVSVNKAERERSVAYEKRDEERALKEEAEAQIERLEHDKDVLITQKRDVHRQLEQVKAELSNTRQALATEKHTLTVLTSEKQALQAQLKQLMTELDDLHRSPAVKQSEPQAFLAFHRFDEVWKEAVDILSSHLYSVLSIQHPVDKPIQLNERWSDWQRWQQIESALVQPLLAITTPIIDNLEKAGQAQKLLALRWYLLEWIKLSIHEALLTKGHITNRAELEGES